MRFTKCLICSSVYSTSGIAGHLRFKHNIQDPLGHYELLPVDQGSQDLQEQNTYPIGTKSFNPAGSPLYPAGQDPLDQLEQQVTKQLRILNLQNMINSLQNPQQQQNTQMSEIDQFSKFVSAYKNIQDSILDNMPEPEPIAEGGGWEDKLISIALQMFLQSKQQTQNLNSTEPIQQVVKIPSREEIDAMILSEQITVDQALSFLQQQGFNFSREEVVKYFNEVRKKKNEKN